MDAAEVKAPEELAIDNALESLQDLVNNAIETRWVYDKPDIVEQAIKLFTPPPPKPNKQRTYAIKRLEAAEYKRSREAGEPTAEITEQQILAEMEQMEKEKQAKAAKKAK